MKILLATRNAKKLLELQRILDAAADIADVTIVGLADVEAYDEVPESGLTFEDNALLKAQEGAVHTGLPTVADDSASTSRKACTPGCCKAWACRAHRLSTMRAASASGTCASPGRARTSSAPGQLSARLSSRRDLPTPLGPSTTQTCPRPLRAAVNKAESCASSASRSKGSARPIPAIVSPIHPYPLIPSIEDGVSAHALTYGRRHVRVRRRHRSDRVR